MKKKYILLNIAVYIIVSFSIVIGVYFFNILIFPSSEIVSSTDVLFVEGIMFLIIGLLLLLGRGGISLVSKKAAILSATAEAVYGADTAGPAETMRRDAWKAEGFIRAGLILIITGVFMLAIYFLTL